MLPAAKRHVVPTKRAQSPAMPPEPFAESRALPLRRVLGIIRFVETGARLWESRGVARPSSVLEQIVAPAFFSPLRI
jgi:hypothetical protein